MTRRAAVACLVAVTIAGADGRAQQTRRPGSTTPLGPVTQLQRNRAAIAPEALLLAADRIRADRWFPESTTFDDARTANRDVDMDLLVLASTSEDPILRRLAVREFGRFETAENALFLGRFLEDEDPDVRIEAADALVQTLIDRPDAPVSTAVQPIQFRLIRERDRRVIFGFWKALAELPLNAGFSARYEREFLNEIQQQSPMRIEAGLALVELLWNRRGRPVADSTVRALREWFLLGAAAGRDVTIGTVTIGDAATFFEALHATGTDDDFVLERADISLNPAIRQRAVEMRNPFNPAHREVLERLASRADPYTKDPAILRLIENPDVPLCDLLPLAQGTETRAAVIRKLAALKNAAVTGCGDWSPDRELLAQAQVIATATAPRTWQTPMVALEQLALRLPDEAAGLVRLHAVGHTQWMVRAVAARLAAVVADPEIAITLMEDPHPNVRADALRSLFILQHAMAVTFAVTALEAKDYHLVRTAADLLHDAPNPTVLLPSIVAAFDRVTLEGKDTSAQTRLMLLERVREFGLRTAPEGFGWAVSMQTHATDFDPVIAKRVAEVIGEVTGNMPEPRPKHRKALQPTEAEIRSAPACLVVQFDDADLWRMQMNRERAPIAVARFWKLAKDGYFTGQDVVHADEALALLGSPGANEYVSTDRYIRDEMGGAVRRGAVIMLGHGRDTLDGRLQHVRKDMRDRDRRDTVLGWVPPSFDPSNRTTRPVLAGNTISRITECPE